MTEWHAQYLLSPSSQLSLPPGTYCRNCAHQELVYEDRSVPGRRGEPVPCCSRCDCGCTAHMVQTFKIRAVIRFRYDEGQPFLKIAYVRGVCLCTKRWQWECRRAIAALDVIQARDAGQLRRFWRAIRRDILRTVQSAVSTSCAAHGGAVR